MNVKTIEGLENLDLSDITDMGYMFAGCSKLESLDIGHWDTSIVDF